MAQASLRHVAALAGVSIKTVSNVVNGHPHVTPATRAKVEKAIAQLGYRPNMYARTLRGGRSGVIALAIPTIDSPYFAEIGRCVIQAAQHRGWTVFIDETDGQPGRELDAVRGLGPHLIDGLIISPLALSAADLAGQSVARPVVMLGERGVDGTVDHVAIDNIAAALRATNHLIEAGRKRIAAIGDQPYVATDTARLRLAGYRASLAEAGIRADADLVRQPSDFTREEGAKAMRELMALPHPPDAVFCFNDLLAIGAMRTLHELGYSVPDDVAVVGWDDTAEGRFSVPSLTSVSPDKKQIAESAVSLLAGRLAGEALAAAQEVEVSFTLQIRESSASLAPGKAAGLLR